MNSLEQPQGATNPAPAGSELAVKPDTILRGPNGIRAGWRLLIYIALVLALGFAPFFALRPLNAYMQSVTALNAGELSGVGMIITEGSAFIVVFFSAWVMSSIEKRKLGEYGIPLNQALGKLFWEGMLWGIVAVSALVGAIAGFKGYSFGDIAQTNKDIWFDGILFLVGFLLVGFFEEFTFRGYTQYTLTSGIGFWPAAGILSGLFGAVHLGNPGEGWVGAANAFAIAMFFCLTLRRTGTLWFAIGLHCSFDWGETFLYSVPNSGTTSPGSLSHATLHGARWLTGGSIGPEGSVFCFAMIALMFVIFDRLHPAKPE